MILNDYDIIIKENFNLFDAPTRRMIVALDEKEQTQLLSALSNSLYKKITSDMDKIDFGTIPRSRGDITKVERFDDTEECLAIMKKLVQEYRQDTTIVDTVLEAVTNIKQRKNIFMKGFATNNSLVTSIYNLIVLAIEESVSFLVSVCIQYIKDPETKSMSMALNKVAYYNTKNNVVYEQLVSFNESCANGNMDKVLNGVMANANPIKEEYDDIAIVAKIDNAPDREVDMPSPIQHNVKDVPDPNADVVQEEEPETDTVTAGNSSPATPDAVASDDIAVNGSCQATNESIIGTIGTVTTVVGATVAVVKLIPIAINLVRHLVYFFLYSVFKFSDTLDVQAQALEMNAYALQNSEYTDDNDLDDKQKATIARKQLKVADTLKKWSNKIAMAFNKSDKKTRDRVAKEDKTRYTADSLRDELPADIYNKSVLF